MQKGSALVEIALIVVVAALLIFFMFNNRKKQKARQDQLSNDLVPGATVMTTFGLYGTVLSVDADENKVTIESGPGTVIVLHKQAIGQIQAPASAETSEPVEPNTDVEATADDATETDTPAADGKPRITDAELDAMNEAKRAEQNADEATDAAAEADAEDADAADSADADAAETAKKSESDK